MRQFNIKWIFTRAKNLYLQENVKNIKISNWDGFIRFRSLGA
jgi:hypothetical protein